LIVFKEFLLSHYLVEIHIQWLYLERVMYMLGVRLHMV